jgi:hypothetical protein
VRLPPIWSYPVTPRNGCASAELAKARSGELQPEVMGKAMEEAFGEQSFDGM